MFKTQEQYDYVKNILVTRMSNYYRPQFKLRKLYEIISEKTSDEAYFSFDYSDFYKMFVEECINKEIPNHKFKITDEGYLDVRQRIPYANIAVDFKYIPKRAKRKSEISHNL